MATAAVSSRRRSPSVLSCSYRTHHHNTSPFHADVNCQHEVVFKYTEALALDLRVFAKHGKRAVVGVDDVKCVARKDPKMVRVLLSGVSFLFCVMCFGQRHNVSFFLCDWYAPGILNFNRMNTHTQVQTALAQRRP